MGDAFPHHSRRIRLLLAHHTGFGRSILEAPEDLDASRSGISPNSWGAVEDLAFEGGYHGLSYGAVAWPCQHVGLTSFQNNWAAMRHARARWFDTGFVEIGAVLVEPIQGRGGIRVPPSGWLAELISACCWCAVRFILVWSNRFIRAHTEDLICVCVGKGMAGGLRISCMKAKVMDAGEHLRRGAIHAQTFLGHPLGCAAALSVLEWCLPHVDEMGIWIRQIAGPSRFSTRGAGLMLGIEVDEPLAMSRS